MPDFCYLPSIIHQLLTYMKLTIFFWFLLSAQWLTAQPHRPEIHCKHFFYGYPYGTPETNDLIIRDPYALSSNDDTKLADWVAYRLSMHEVDGDLTVERAWKADPWLEDSETLEPDDYTGAHQTLRVDRGHQTPLGSFKGSRHASQTNLLSNITPQKSALNQGVWMQLESRVREIVRDLGEVYVITGPVYEREMPSLPGADEPHKVPSGYWKIVCVQDGGGVHAAAFFFDQDTPRNNKILAHQVTIDEIEDKTGLDFLWLLDDDTESAVEQQTNTPFAERYFAE